jgi:RimJ/RimL family protein N-acetyltransferase
MQHYNFQDPRGNHYIIRDIDPPVDTLAYYEYICNKDITSNLDIPHYTSLEDVRRDIYHFSTFTPEEGKCFAVAQCENNKLIGTLGYNCVSGDIAELVVDLNPNYWNLGIMEIPFKWLFNYMKDQKIQKVLATVKPDNKRVLNGLKRFDFQQKTNEVAINLCGKLVYSKSIC